MYEDFVFSCVVDSQPTFQLQVQNWIATLTGLAGIPGSQIVVHTVADIDSDLAAWMRTLGVILRPLQAFSGSPYCNKLMQISELSNVDRPYVVMMDCDTVVSRPVQWPRPKHFSAKRVDVATPPQSILSNIFAAAQLGEPKWVESDILPGVEGVWTDSNNCNGGVYVVERSFLSRIGPVWLHWARWCVEQKHLFGRFDQHIDQVSLALAATDLNAEIEPLPRSLNMPTHMPLALELDLDPQVIHYHSNVDNQLLLKMTCLPHIDAAITRVNEHLRHFRRVNFINSLFFGARYELFPELGAGIGSQAENLLYKQNLLNELVTEEESVLDVGCGDLAVSRILCVSHYLGIDVAPSAIDTARQLRPDWEFLVGNPQELELAERDVVICFDVLIHQPTYEQYLQLTHKLCMLTRDTLIVGAYDCEPVFTSTITFYYESILKTLSDAGGFAEISVVGKYRDIAVIVARKRQPSIHPRDLSSADFNLMSRVTDYPLSLRCAVDKSRAEIGFFPAHTPRTLEYPWILNNLPKDLQSKTILDVGAGVNPLPLLLADRGAAVVTLDNHREIRDVTQRSQWNEWGFLDYSSLDRRITSIFTSYETWTTPTLFDCIYSVSVIEHLPAATRRLWVEAFSRQVKIGQLLLLTVDLIPETDLLWNFAEGRMVEPEHLHGTLGALREELESFGFAVESCSIKRNVPASRVDIGFICARRRLQVSQMSAGLPRISGHALYNLDWVNKLEQPFTLSDVRAFSGGELTVSGWAADATAKMLAAGVEVILDHAAYEAAYGLERHDVAAHFNESGYARSGFKLTLPGDLLTKGVHDLQIRVISTSRGGYWEGLSLKIECE
jgi:2-polyprenyl-3-methyl-5-hydroxy-6-metoxy-1,4-benzoquinol methylase